MSTCWPETCRGLKLTYCIKELCVKFVTYQKLYQDARSAKYKKLYLLFTIYSEKLRFMISFGWGLNLLLCRRKTQMHISTCRLAVMFACWFLQSFQSHVRDVYCSRLQPLPSLQLITHNHFPVQFLSSVSCAVEKTSLIYWLPQRTLVSAVWSLMLDYVFIPPQQNASFRVTTVWLTISTWLCWNLKHECCTLAYDIWLIYWKFNLIKPTGHVMHQQFNIQELYALPTLYLCVLFLSENKQRLVPLTA